MMQTINISLPEKLSSRVEDIVQKEGYASKSEFFRTILRLYFHLIAKKKDNFFLPYKKQSLNRVKSQLKSSNQYSDDFINSIIDGLGKSSLYNGD